MSALLRIPDSSRTSPEVRKVPEADIRKGQAYGRAARRQTRDQQQACQRKPDNRISHVIVGQMHLKRPGFRDAARKHWSLQIDVDQTAPERLGKTVKLKGETE